MLPTIRNVKPLHDCSVEVHWADGSVSVIPFNDVIAKGGIFSQLADPVFQGRGRRGRRLYYLARRAGFRRRLALVSPPIRTKPLKNSKW